MDSKEKMKVELVDLARRFKRVHPTPPKEVRELSQVEMHALIGVARVDEKGLFLRPSDIARMSHTSPSAVSQVLKSLEQHGFLSVIEWKEILDRYKWSSPKKDVKLRARL